jgi:hypothetical protein
MQELISINSPQRLISPGLKSGNQVVIHILKKEFVYFEVVFKYKRAKLTFEITTKNCSQINDDIKKFVEEFSKKIENADDVCSQYYYLFVYDKTTNCCKLLSIALDDVAIGYSIVKDVCKELNIPIMKPLWKGEYFFINIAAFYEDIFIQKLWR